MMGFGERGDAAPTSARGRAEGHVRGSYRSERFSPDADTPSPRGRSGDSGFRFTPLRGISQR